MTLIMKENERKYTYLQVSFYPSSLSIMIQHTDPAK